MVPRVSIIERFHCIIIEVLCIVALIGSVLHRCIRGSTVCMHKLTKSTHMYLCILYVTCSEIAYWPGFCIETYTHHQSSLACRKHTRYTIYHMLVRYSVAYWPGFSLETHTSLKKKFPDCCLSNSVYTALEHSCVCNSYQPFGCVEK